MYHCATQFTSEFLKSRPRRSLICDSTCGAASTTPNSPVIRSGGEMEVRAGMVGPRMSYNATRRIVLRSPVDNLKWPRPTCNRDRRPGHTSVTTPFLHTLAMAGLVLCAYLIRTRITILLYLREIYFCTLVICAGGEQPVILSQR
jgi:hypothetical protein